MLMRHVILSCALLISATWMACPRAMVAPASPAATITTTKNKQPSPLQCNILDRYYFQSLPGAVANCYAHSKWRQGHYQAAIRRFMRAAGWGSKEAQYSLGLIYYTGRHVDTNKALGLAWLELAAERHDAHKELIAKSAKALASPQQRKHAHRLLSHMLAQYGDKVAAKRAWEHYEHSLRYKKMSKMVMAGPACQNLPNPSGRGVAPDMASNLATNLATNIQAQVSCQIEEMNRRKMETQQKSLVGKYFHGWQGTVTVGPLQSIPAAAATSGD